MIEETDVQDPELDDALPSQLPIDDEFVERVELALTVGNYPPQYREGEMAADMREAKLFALEVDRAGRIRAAQMAGTKGIIENAQRRNVTAAARTSQLLEKQIALSLSAMDKITAALVSESQTHDMTMGRVEAIARLMSASAASGVALSRLRDGGKTERVTVIEDRRR